jgi:hypothetical protein
MVTGQGSRLLAVGVALSVVNFAWYLLPNHRGLFAGVGDQEHEDPMAFIPASLLKPLTSEAQSPVLMATSSAAPALGQDAERLAKQIKEGRGGRKKNVVMIMTDDLRPSLSIYGRPVITPNFERLARESVVFERAYNQDPICNPSRNSLMSGRRPDTTRVWLFEDQFPHSFKHIPQYFRSGTMGTDAILAGGGRGA